MPSDIPERWREGHPSFGSFKHGQLVLRKSVFRGRETVDKFAERFEGPYSVIKVNLNGVTYMLKHNTTENIVKAHHSQLRRYCVPPAYIVRHPYWITLQQSDDKKHAVDEPDGWIFDRTGEANTSISLDSVEFSSGSCNSCTSTYGSDSDSLPDSHGVPVGTRSELEISDHVVTSPAVADLLGLEGDDVIPPWDLRRLKPNQGHEGCSIIPLATQLDELVHPMEMVPPVVQSESFSFEATDQLPSGLVLEGSAEFWDVSDIYSDQSAVNDASDLYSEKENPLDIELQLLTENIDLLQTILESERLSFSGFGSTDGIIGDRDPISLGEDVANRSQRNVFGQTGIQDMGDNQSRLDRVKAAEDHLSEIRNSVDRLRRSSLLNKRMEAGGLGIGFPRTPISTRFRGAVPNFPHVMSKALEHLSRDP